jgi:fibronectin-binding autotransporter adhesin
MKAGYQLVKQYLFLQSNLKNSSFFRYLLFLIICSVFSLTKINAQITYTWAGGTSTAWNNTANWTKSSGTSFPGTNATDIVIIPTSGTNAPTLNTALSTSIASLTFTNTATTTLTITGVTLTVTGAVQINHANTNRTITLTGTGSIVCGSFTIGTNTLGITLTAARTLTYVNTLTGGIDATTGNFTMQALRSGGNNGNITVTHTSGAITASSFVTSLVGTGGPPTVNYAMGNTSPRLNLEGATPLSFSASVTNTIDFIGTGAIVDYQGTSNFTIPATPAGVNSYTGLNITGGNNAIKTFSANLSVAGGLTVNAATTLALGTFTLGGGLTSITMQTVGGGNGAAITGSGAITLGGNITVNYTGTGAISTNASIDNPVALGATRQITVADDGDLTNDDFTISGIISGNNFGITKLGAGALALTGANTYTGAVTITAGILEVNTVANASTSSSLGTGAGTPAISMAGAGTLRYVGTGHSTSRAITLTASGATIEASGSGLLTMSGAVSGNTFGLVLGGTGTGLYNGVIGTTSGTVTKTGTGNWELSAANTYTGVTTISGGTLMAGAAVAVSTNGPFGNAASAVVMGTAATTTNNWSPTLLIDGAFTFARAITIANQSTSGVYSIGGNTDNNATFSGTITFSQPFSITQVATTSTNILTVSASITGGLAGTKNVTFDNVGAVTKITNAIANGTGTTAVIKSNSGTLTMGVANGYTGGTILNAGTINVNNTSALGTVAGTFVINGGAVQNTTGGSITTNNHPMTWNADFSFTGSQPLNLGTGTVTMNADIQITTSTAAVALTVGGGISAAARTLTKAGAGTLTFVSQTISLNDLSIDAGVLISTSGTMNISGIFTNNATFTHNSGTVNMNNTASSIVNNSTLTFNNLTISATPTAQTQYNTSFNVAATLTVNGGVTFAPTGGTITMNNVASSISNSGTLTFNNLTISATPTAQSQYNTNFSVAGTLATSGAINFSPSGGTITMSGATGAINNASGTLVFSNLIVSGTTVSSTGNFSVVTTMSVTGEFNPSATSIISGAGTLTGTGTVNVTRTAATPSFGAQYTIANKTLVDLTVDYNGAGAQTVSAADYGTLVISTNGTRTVTFENGGTVRVSNLFTPTTTTTTYVVTGNTFEYNGSGAQTITAFTYNNLIISNAGAKTVLAGTTVNCQTIEINDSAVLTLPNTSALNVQG